MTMKMVSSGVPESLTGGVSQQGTPGGDSSHRARPMPRFAGVTTRFLRPEEHAAASQFRCLPLVLEAQTDSSQSFLEGFLRSHGEAVVESAHDHGAVLLRGFRITSEQQFEAAISSVSSFRPMGGYFMSEQGRTPVKSGSHVFHTNAVVRTGGGFKKPGRGLHTENYYSTDVPAFISFWCKEPAWLGGETAISLLSAAYSQLGESTRRRFESAPSYQVRFVPLEAVARRYAVTSRTMQRCLEALGVPMVEDSGHRHVGIAKPAVVQHPFRAQKCLQLNMADSLPGFNEAMVDRFLPYYSGWPWALYRQAWKRPVVNRVGQVLTNLPLVFSSRQALRHYLLIGWNSWVSKPPPELRPKRTEEGARIADKLSAEEIHALADAAWRHSSVFAWKQGDVLILDNLQVAHTGMPGWGRRVVRAMLCNPIRFLVAPEGGAARLEVGPESRSIHDRLCELLRGEPSNARHIDAA